MARARVADVEHWEIALLRLAALEDAFGKGVRWSIAAAGFARLEQRGFVMLVDLPNRGKRAIATGAGRLVLENVLLCMRANREMRQARLERKELDARPGHAQVDRSIQCERATPVAPSSRQSRWPSWLAGLREILGSSRGGAPCR